MAARPAEAARQARWAVSAQFLVMGMTGGMWMSRVPAAKAQAHLTDGTLGLALFAAPVGLILGAVLAERLVDRVGSAWVARVGGLASRIGLHAALAIPAVLALWIAVGASALCPRPPAYAWASPPAPDAPQSRATGQGGEARDR
jgi:hypothetical protein